MNGVNLNKIFLKQEKILKIVFSFDNSFYLTGGTALNRFYFPYRISEDLDFFSSQNFLYYEQLKLMTQKFEENNIKYQINTYSKDFARFYIEDIQVDFVNDRVYREGTSNIIDGFKIDNIINILTNKLCTIVNRDEEKDFFDLFVIAKNYIFNWGKIIEIANKKQYIEKSILVNRIKTFPLDWLSKIKIIKKFEIIHDDIEKLILDCIEDRDNSLYKNEK